MLLRTGLQTLVDRMTVTIDAIEKRYWPYLRRNQDERMHAIGVDNAFVSDLVDRLNSAGFAAVNSPNLVLALPDSMQEDACVFDSKKEMRRSKVIKELKLDRYYIYLYSRKDDFSEFIKKRFDEVHGFVHIGDQEAVTRLMHKNGLHWVACTDES